MSSLVKVEGPGGIFGEEIVFNFGEYLGDFFCSDSGVKGIGDFILTRSGTLRIVVLGVTGVTFISFETFRIEVLGEVGVNVISFETFRCEVSGEVGVFSFETVDFLFDFEETPNGHFLGFESILAVASFGLRSFSFTLG